MKGACPLAYYWGVDSAEEVTEDLYDLVEKEYGKPAYWGRYLAPIPGKVAGLTREEVHFIRSRGIKLLPVLSNFDEAVGYREGKVVAQNAIYHARRLSIPKGRVVFGNIEKNSKVDEEWIRGYVDAMSLSGYKAGLCHSPDRGEFNKAYCAAVAKDNKVANHLILWSAGPEPGPTRARNAPNFRPKKPPCKANVWGWQYGRDAQRCPIDTNLFNSRLYELLW